MCFRILLALSVTVASHLAGVTSAPAATSRSLTLRECLEMAISRNVDIQIEQLQAEIAGYNLNGAYGAYVPVLSFQAKHDFVSQPANFDPQKFNLDQPYELNSDLLGPGLSGQLPVGLTYSFSAYAREDNARTDFSGNVNDARFFPGGIRSTNNYFSEARIEVQQHLLKDFWIDANRKAILVRRKEAKMSQQAVRFQVMKTVLAVELAYYDLFTEREQVRVQEEALKLRQQFVTETRRRVELGDLPPLDADEAETELQNTLTALSVARERLATQQNVLKGLITDDFAAWVDIHIEPTDVLLVLPMEVNRAEIFQFALKNRPDLIEARLAVEKSAVIVRYRKNQLFPNLDLVGRYGGLGVDPEPGSSLHNTFSFQNPEYFYGAVLSFPLSLAPERGNYRASKAAKEISELQLKKAEEEVLLQLADHANRVPSRFDQVTSTRKARAFAQAALAAQEKKLQAGLCTSFEVLQLQQTLITARTAEVQAVARYNRTLAELDFAAGTILEKNQLSFR